MTNSWKGYIRLIAAWGARLVYSVKQYWHKNWWHKAVVLSITAIVLCVGTMYGIARWYIWQQSSKPLTLGVTFDADYAKSLGLNPQTTMHALVSDLGVRQFRLTSYWSDIEQTKGTYDFSTLDWEFAQADAVHATVTLSIGLRQPRWPECHMPAWAAQEPANLWNGQLNSFIQAVITRYQHNPALQSYQLENEFLLTNFGTCTDFSRSRVNTEFNLVKQLDSNHPVIMTRSNNYGGLAVGKPVPDIYGISVYRRVWIPFLHRYAEYPFPAWYYAFLAGAQELLNGKPSILHELQAEPWPPDGSSIAGISLSEQNKSLDPTRFKQVIQFGKATGMRTIDLWGAEYWYYRMVTLHDSSFWNIAKQAFAKE